jgi:hypothetical protein
MKKMVVMEVLWWLWRLKMKIEGGFGLVRVEKVVVESS